MASHFVFGFLFLLCHVLPLLSASSDEGGSHEECGMPWCGYLGEIYFPFTTSKKLECGLQISGCDSDDAVKHIKLGNRSYIIDSIHQEDKYNSIFIFDDSAAEIDLESPPFHVLNTINFSICSDRHRPPYENMIRYRHCFSYGIYFRSDYYDLELPILPFACSPEYDQQLDLPPGQCKSLFSFQIGVQSPKSCEDCYHARSQCRLNHANFSCFNGPPPSSPYPDAVTKGKEQHLKAAIVGLSIGLATMTTLALLAILFLYKQINKSSCVQNQPRSIYSGPYRSTTNPASGAVYFGIPVFSYEELQEATHNFDPARELGEGGFGTVYHGKLRDGREVAVKRLFERNYRPVESFNNEIQILTRMRHTNLVSLYGCTSRHSRELLLVYEYIPNGTLSCHLHGDRGKHGLLPWPVRMKIAIETAGALAYLHASDIIHRDVKSSNILLDNNFCVKVADFGLSRLFPTDATHVSTAPRGTPGYVDPDYRICYQLTSKSDVYSFGVVLVELISSLPAVDMARDRDEIKLANLAIRKIQRRAFCELIDPSLGFQSDDKLKRMIISVAELAFQCLQGDKELRPSMGEVLEVLHRIESGKDEPGNLERIDVHGARISQSYTHPPLPNTSIIQQRNHQTF